MCTDPWQKGSHDMQVCLAQAHQFELVQNISSWSKTTALSTMEVWHGFLPNETFRFLSQLRLLNQLNHDCWNNGTIHQVSETMNPQNFFTSTTLKGIVTYGLVRTKWKVVHTETLCKSLGQRIAKWPGFENLYKFMRYPHKHGHKTSGRITREMIIHHVEVCDWIPHTGESTGCCHGSSGWHIITPKVAVAGEVAVVAVVVDKVEIQRGRIWRKKGTSVSKI